ncbi:MAG TPA: alpha/beta fold hydrolase [Candidatus Angelobacter sp.]|nr:alpha/beta fold hydrolase [Candidatus Angelobacter sp.]
MGEPIELAVHEWPPHGDPNSPRVAILVHGLAGWSRTWWRVGPALADRGWRVLAVDGRAHGRSPAARAATVDELARDLEAAIERHATAPVDALVGHSLGAAVSQRLAWQRPDIARRLILEDPPSLDRRDDGDFLDRLRAEVEAARTRPEDEITRELAENPSWMEGDARQDVEGRALMRVDVVVESLQLGRGFHVSELAGELRIPARYILAAEDRSVMVGEARRRLIANLPEGSDAIILDGGHTLHRDRFDDYLAAVLNFVG